jgi:hypothetical protein
MELSEYHMWWKREGARGMRDLLMTHWDPIGVRGIPEAADEYDSYGGHIAGALREGASVEDVSAYLSWARTEHMEISPDPEADFVTATAVVEWYRKATANE